MFLNRGSHIRFAFACTVAVPASGTTRRCSLALCDRGHSLAFLSPPPASVGSLPLLPGKPVARFEAHTQQQEKGTPHGWGMPFSGGEGETRTLAPGLIRPTPLAGAPRHQLEYFSIRVVHRQGVVKNSQIVLYMISPRLSSPFPKKCHKKIAPLWGQNFCFFSKKG